ncbi:AraC family transcriptional regulator [Streptomyces odontomachi]|uniref:AraC family transcriptional regulator n=1 Tax=Streptomyces odontomachi TaxID=2944940 RepID=UPI00210BA307|nr:AraC family transcriptional regulator [Streptomyces sp. ODS25]
MSPPPPATRLPLSRFEQLHTADVDQARHVVAEAFCPHRLTALDKARRFETRFHAIRTSQVSLCYLDYGGRVHIAPHEQESFYLVLIPLAGQAELSHGRERALYDAKGAGVPPVDRTYHIHVSAGSPHLVVRIARDRLEEHLRSMLARPVDAPIRFDLGMDMTAPAIRSWRRVVNLLLDEIDGDGLIPRQPLAMRELERLLLGQLLLAQPNNYSALLHGPPRGTAPKAIRRAAELIETHAAEPLTVEDLAEATGLSVRTLQEGFRRFLDTTPMSHLREIRLRHAREELTAADPTSTTVTEIAARWGFLHAGRFSARYHKRFGESPSVTLRH